MKKLSFLMMMLVAMLVLASCSSAPKSQKLVPEDALMVMRVDLMQMGDKSGLGSGDSKLVDKLKKELKNIISDKELRKRIESIIDEPSESGIDLTEPVYGYMALENSRRGDPREAGVVGTLSSSSKLTELLNALCEESSDMSVEESDGINYLAFGRKAKHGAIIYGDDWFFAGMGEGEVDDLIDELKERLDGKGTLDGNEAYQKMCEKESLMQLLVLGKGVENVEGIEYAIRTLPDGAELGDVAVLIDTELGEGELSVITEFIAMSDAWNDYIEKGDKLYSEIDGSLARYISGDGLAMFANVKGKSLAQVVDQVYNSMPRGYGYDEEANEALNQIKSLCEAVKGPIAFSLSGIKNDNPVIAVYAETKDNSIVEFMGQQMADDNDSTLAFTNTYRIPINYEYEDIYDEYGNWVDWKRIPKDFAELGYENGNSYFVMGQKPFQTQGSAFSTSKLKGLGFYANFNFDLLKPFLNEFNGPEGRVAKKIFNGLKDAEMYYEGNGKVVFRVTTAKKDTNPIKLVAEAVQELAR